MANMDERRLHQTVSLLGLRAQATAVGFVRLTTEMVQAGVLDQAALGRIKTAIAGDLMLSAPPSVKKSEFESWVNRRLDGLFACEEPMGDQPHPPGEEDFGKDASAA